MFAKNFDILVWTSHIIILIVRTKLFSDLYLCSKIFRYFSKTSFCIFWCQLMTGLICKKSYFFCKVFYTHTHTEQQQLKLSTRGRAKSGLSADGTRGREKEILEKMWIDEKQDLRFSLGVRNAWKRFRATRMPIDRLQSQLKIERSINFCYLYELVNRWISLTHLSSPWDRTVR